MLTTKQITEIMGCCVQTAKRKMEEAGIKVQMQSFAHGRKAYWNVTVAQVREIMTEQEKDPEQIAVKQGAALNALESLFNRQLNAR